MKLTIVGGGGFRVPLIYRALLVGETGSAGAGLSGRGAGSAGADGVGVSEVALYDTDPRRLTAVATVLAQQAELARSDGTPRPARVTVHSDLDTALRGASFVFSAVRVGGLWGRTVDERTALELGVLGQETVGAGGIAYGLRTVPVALELARRIAAQAPEAWVVNFTNPAGLVTEAMRSVLGDHVIGICDSPAGLVRRAVSAALSITDEVDHPALDQAGHAALQADKAGVGEADVDYVGLNHLGWLRGISINGRDLLPRLLADRAALESFEEGRLFGAEWIRRLGCIPNEYLHYFYYARESLAAMTATERTRGEFLREQQEDFYAAVQDHPASALRVWQQARAERDASYLAEARAIAGAGARAETDLQAGGYEDIALRVMRAVARDEPSTVIVNVANGSTLAALDRDAVIEVPCTIDARGAHPRQVAALSDHQAGLMCSVKAVERSVIEAAATGSVDAAVRAFALHPLIDSVTVAQQLLEQYRARLPELAYLG